MSAISKYISLKKYIPTGNPNCEDFSLKTKELKLEKNNQVLIGHNDLHLSIPQNITLPIQRIYSGENWKNDRIKDM